MRIFPGKSKDYCVKWSEEFEKGYLAGQSWNAHGIDNPNSIIKNKDMWDAWQDGWEEGYDALGEF